jgi:hypothetical protein
MGRRQRFVRVACDAPELKNLSRGVAFPRLLGGGCLQLPGSSPQKSPVGRSDELIAG